MPQNRFAVVLVAFAVSLVLLPALAAAEGFTLPAKAVYLESWEYWAVCVNPPDCWYHNYGNAYTPDSFVVYRTLIGPDGMETVLDYAPQGDNIRNYYPTYYHSLSASVPELPLELNEPGDYRVELRLIRMPKATANHNPGLAADSTVDWWIAERVKPGPGIICTVPWNENECWAERLVESGVKLSDRSQLLEYYEITVASPAALPNSPENNIDRSSISIISVSSPFSDSKGASAKSDTNAQTAGMALTGILAVGAIGAGAYLYRSYTASTGSSFNAYQTAAGKANEAAVLAEKEKIRRMDEEYAEKMRQYNLKKTQAAYLAQQSALNEKSAQLQKDLANIQSSKSYADAGSSYALLAAKYSDILTDDGKKQLIAASNAAWSANATVTTTAVFSPKVLARQPDPVQPQPVKQDYYSVNNLWNDFTGAISGLGKTVYLGVKEQYEQYSDIASMALKGDLWGADRKLKEKNLRDMAFVGQTVMDHWEEIAWGIGVAAVVVVAVVTAPVWVPAVAVAVGVSAATVTAVGVGVGAAAAVGTVYYAATTYGAKLNNVDDACTLEDGSAKACVDARRDVVEQGIVDGTIVAASVGIGSGSSTWAKAVAKANVVDHPNVLKAMETILKPRRVKVIKDTEYLYQRNARGIYNINTKKLTYGDQTRFGDLMHEVRHSTDHAKAGYPTTETMTKAERQVYMAESEVNAYLQDFENAKTYETPQREIDGTVISQIKENLRILKTNGVDVKTLNAYDKLKYYGLVE